MEHTTCERRIEGGPNMSFGAGGTPLPSQAAHSGATPSGSLEPTEKLGALNPEFVSWLMGYPPEWLSCAPSATRSSHKSQRSSSKPT